MHLSASRLMLQQLGSITDEKLCGLIEHVVKNQKHHSDEQIMWLDRKCCEKPKAS